MGAMPRPMFDAGQPLPASPLGPGPAITPATAGVYPGNAGERSSFMSRARAAGSQAAQLRQRAAAARERAIALESATAAALWPDLAVPREELLRRSEYVRLRARLETMPVIEQAKGILMAHSRCDAEEAFGLLRRASQRSNIPVRDLAAQLVAKTIRSPATLSHVPRAAGGQVPQPHDKPADGHRPWPDPAAQSANP